MTSTTTFSVPDIMCGGCANAIKKALAPVPGVSSVEVDVPQKTVTVTHDQTASREAVVASLGRAGFPVTEGDGGSACSCCRT